MPTLTVPPGVEGLSGLTQLPDADWQNRWDRIIVSPDIKERLLNYTVFALRNRGRFSSVGMPLHGLVILAGPPGTGKTTLAGGVADQAARLLGGGPLVFADLDPHSLPSQLLGESQRGVARLFERTIPDLAERGHPTIILLDEVEALAVSRSRASLETNPVDVHRATDAVLSGIDHVAASCPNVIFVATTNYAVGVDAAFLSRADLLIEVGLPGAEAMAAILLDTLREVISVEKIDKPRLASLARACATAELDARQARKLVLHAIIRRQDLALDPSQITLADLDPAVDAALQDPLPA